MKPVTIERIAALLAAVAMLAAAGSAAAQTPDCRAPKSTLEESQCADLAQKAVEARLNAVYQRVLKTFGDRERATARNKLVAAQRIWVKFREADCDAVSEKWVGASVRSEMFSACMQKHAEDRIKDLEDFDILY